MYMKTKMTEQVIVKAAYSGTLSAGTTAGICCTSEAINRLDYNTAYIVLQGKCATAGGTCTFTLTVADSDVATGTFTLVATATWTTSLLPTSAATTAAGLAINLAAFNKYLKLYATSSGTLTNQITISMVCILGDGKTEPAT